MQVKDKVVNWWLQNIIIPRSEIIDKPGFIVTTFTEKKRTTYLREFMLSEQLLEFIEKKIIEKFGNQGKQALYSAGKKFGYLYASLSNFPTIYDISKQEFSDFAYLVIRYISGTYAKQANHNLDLDKKTITISFDNYIVCRNNGLGYIMLDGAVSGLWSYEMQDKTIEGAQLKCQGRGDPQCLIICGPLDELKNNTDILFKENDLPELKFDEVYKRINQIRETTYSKNSLKKLIDLGFFKYKEGTISYKTIRFFHCESHILYLLEEEISKLPNGEDFLFDICFEYGKFVKDIYGKNDYKKFILDYYPALGYGDILVRGSKEPEIYSIYYPWTNYSEKSKYIIFRGIMSGIVTDSMNNKIEFKNFKTDLKDYLTLTIYQ